MRRMFGFGLSCAFRSDAERNVAKRQAAARRLVSSNGTSDARGVQRIVQDRIVDRFLPGGEFLLELVADLSRVGVVVQVLLLVRVVLQVVQLIQTVGEVVADELPRVVA